MRRDVVNKFNRGELDPTALARDDVERVNNSAESMINFLPQRLGPMMYRPGTLYVGDDPGDFIVPFVRSTTETAILGFTTTALKVWVDGTVVDQPSGVMTLSNQTFDSNITSWTNASGAGSTAAWVTGGYASLTGNTSTSAKLHQTFGGTGFAGVEHCIQITILEAPVTVKIGESGVDSKDIFEGVLEPGTHSLVFTPVTSLPTITLSNNQKYRALVDEVSIGTDIDLSLPLPETITDVSTIRYTQSADVVFIATGNTMQFKVERRGSKSWSVVPYRADNGPFGLINNTEVTLAAGALEGNTTLTASSALFTESSVGVLYRLISSGQESSANVTAQDTGTGSVRVTGVDNVRDVSISRTGSWSATVTLQRSTDDATWSDVETYTGTGNNTYNDGLDNQILYYRLWVKTGDYTSGTVVLNIGYASGSQDGICRVTSYTSATVVDVQVLQPFGKTDATRDWYRGEWGGTKGYPTAVALYESRLWWAGKTVVWGSESDGFASFDDLIEGGSRYIRRTIGFGPVDRVEWLAPSSRLLMGLASDVISVRSSSFGEVITQDNANLKSASSMGTHTVEPIKVNDDVLFIQRSATRLIEASYNVEKDSHLPIDLTILNPDIARAGIKRAAVSMQPEVRIYMVMDDGTMRVYLFDQAESVTAWSRVTLGDGTFTDITTLPGLVEDEVWVTVTRGGTSRLERFSRLEDATEEHFDGALVLTSPGVTISGLGHLEGSTVGVWGDNQDRGDYTVVSGEITVPANYGRVTVGLRYTATYKSNKLGAKTGAPSLIGRTKRVVDVHLMMKDYWPAAIRHGPSEDLLEDMPLLEDGVTLSTNQLVAEYDEYPIEFNGEEEIDPRIHLEATGPCTILAMSYGLLHESKADS